MSVSSHCLWKCFLLPLPVVSPCLDLHRLEQCNSLSTVDIFSPISLIHLLCIINVHFHVSMNTTASSLCLVQVHLFTGTHPLNVFLIMCVHHFAFLRNTQSWMLKYWCHKSTSNYTQVTALLWTDTGQGLCQDLEERVLLWMFNDYESGFQLLTLNPKTIPHHCKDYKRITHCFLSVIFIA